MLRLSPPSNSLSPPTFNFCCFNRLPQLIVVACLFLEAVQVLLFLYAKKLAKKFTIKKKKICTTHGSAKVLQNLEDK